MKNFLKELRSINDINSLEKMREQFVFQTFDMSLDWDTRLAIFKKIELLIKRMIELETL
ncbi:hypothetical protein BCE02nite_39600 [Brevibacillus centrosporus]|nr:hypothetical protein BCE02nite_39600 [Brevibacillus centrosporus]